MKRRDSHLTIRQMIDHAREVLQMAQGRTRADLDEDRQLSLALVRLLEIIGEAANRISRDIQARYEDIRVTSTRGSPVTRKIGVTS